MLYYCAYTWHSGTTQQKVAERFVQQEEAGLHHPSGGAGGMLSPAAGRGSCWSRPRTRGS